MSIDDQDNILRRQLREAAGHSNSYYENTSKEFFSYFPPSGTRPVDLAQQGQTQYPQVIYSSDDIVILNRKEYQRLKDIEFRMQQLEK